MCGIVGYTGKKKAAPILLDGLAKLEYRGYDSAGLSVRDGDKNPIVVKAKGRLKVLSEKTDGGAAIKGTCGIGHTRWATHGEPTENNAHPHIVDDYNVVVVIDCLDSDFSICFRIELVTLADHLVTEFLVVLNDSVMYAYNVIVIYDPKSIRKNLTLLRLEKFFERFGLLNCIISEG